MKGLRIKEILKLPPDNREIIINGWVRTKRDSKELYFLEISDGSTLTNMQVIVDKNNSVLSDLANRLTTGASVSVRGKIVHSTGKNQTIELYAENITILGDAPADSYPLQKKRHSFEFLREIGHLRPRTNTFGSIARVRNIICYAIHTFFQERGFVYVQTPIISTSDCEGAGDMFQITTLSMGEIPAENGTVDYSKDFFGKKAALTVSGQLEAEIYASAMTNVYTFGPTFRAENSNTTRHLAEFWMIEPEMAFCDISCNMDLAEEFLQYLLQYLFDHGKEEIDFFDKWIQHGISETLETVITSKFERITYTEAVNKLKKHNNIFEFPVTWGCDLQSEHEKYLTETVFKGPVIVTDYPKEIKAFYMKLNDDGKTVRAMDVLVPRLGEIIGGSERESDYSKLLNRIKELKLNPEDYWWYLELRKFGTVPHSGFGLGLERFIQYITGMQNIRDVIPFPRTVKTAEF